MRLLRSSRQPRILPTFPLRSSRPSTSAAHCRIAYTLQVTAPYSSSSKRPPKPPKASSPLPPPGPYKPPPPPPNPEPVSPGAEKKSQGIGDIESVYPAKINLKSDGSFGYSSSDEPRSRFSRFRFRKWPTPIRLVVLSVAYTFGLSLIGIACWDHVIQLIYVNGGSMTPALNPDYAESHTKKDILVIKKYNPAVDLKRGMIITFPSPSDPNTTAIKRIIALPGDEVTTRKPCPVPKKFVDWNHVWVEGDNANDSRDSTYYGPVSMSLINGQAVAAIGGKTPRRVSWEDWEREAEEDDTSVAAAQKRRVRRNAVDVLDPGQW